MKKLILSIAISLLILGTQAQVTLEHTYNYSTSVVKLETLGYKYFLMDVPRGECRIYNLDHSLIRTINCNVPSGFYLSDIKFLSEKLFDNDDGIELLCSYYKYNNSGAYYQYSSKIINEDGTQITFIDGALYNLISKTDDDTYKLFSYCYDYSSTPEKVWTKIFNLPGMMVSAKSFNDKSPDIRLNAFPNPATQKVNVAYELPDNINSGTLFLIDNNGRPIEQFVVDGHTDHLSLDVNNFSSGVYHYFIEYGNTKTASKKLVIR